MTLTVAGIIGFVFITVPVASVGLIVSLTVAVTVKVVSIIKRKPPRRVILCILGPPGAGKRSLGQRLDHENFRKIREPTGCVDVRFTFDANKEKVWLDFARIIRFLKEKIARPDEEDKNPPNDKPTGDSVYYAANRLFLRSNSVCLLVINLEKGLDETVSEDGYVKGWTVKDYIDFWFSSVYHERGKNARVLIIGTHRDEVKGGDKDLKKIKEAIEKFVTSRPYTSIYRGFLAIDNTQRKDKQGHKIREKILKITYELSLKENPEGIDKLMDKLKELEDKEEYWLSEEEMREICNQLGIINDNSRGNGDDKFKDILPCLQDAGEILYFKELTVEKKIILSQQYLSDRIKELTDVEKQEGSLRSELNEFKDTGIIEHETLNELWGKDAELLIRLLSEVWIFIEKRTKANEGKKYFCPISMPKGKFINPHEFNRTPLVLTTKEKFIPYGTTVKILAELSKTSGWIYTCKSMTEGVLKPKNGSWKIAIKFGNCKEKKRKRSMDLLEIYWSGTGCLGRQLMDCKDKVLETMNMILQKPIYVGLVCENKDCQDFVCIEEEGKSDFTCGSCSTKSSKSGELMPWFSEMKEEPRGTENRISPEENALNKAQTELLDKMKVGEMFLSYFLSAGVLTSPDKKTIMSKPTDHERAAELLDYVVKDTPGRFDVLLTALDETKQQRMVKCIKKYMPSQPPSPQ